MKISINRTRSDPPVRNYSKRNTAEASAERLAAITALQSLKVGQSAEFSGEGVSRDRVNSLIVSARRTTPARFKRQFVTAKTSEGIGVWRLG